MIRIIPDEVIASAQLGEQKWLIPASVTLGQAWILESGWGKSISGKNNYGGITAQCEGEVFPYVPGKPLEPATLCWTHEEYKGKRVLCQRWFKDYKTPDAFFDAHAKLLATGSAFKDDFAKLKASGVPASPAAVDEFVRNIQIGPMRYATDPKYTATLLSIIKSNNLYRFDVYAKKGSV